MHYINCSYKFVSLETDFVILAGKEKTNLFKEHDDFTVYINVIIAQMLSELCLHNKEMRALYVSSRPIIYMIFLIGIGIQLVTSAPANSQSKRVSSIATTTTAMADRK